MVFSPGLYIRIGRIKLFIFIMLYGFFSVCSCSKCKSIIECGSTFCHSDAAIIRCFLRMCARVGTYSGLDCQEKNDRKFNLSRKCAVRMRSATSHVCDRGSKWWKKINFLIGYFLCWASVKPQKVVHWHLACTADLRDWEFRKRWCQKHDLDISRCK